MELDAGAEEVEGQYEKRENQTDEFRISAPFSLEALEKFSVGYTGV